MHIKIAHKICNGCSANIERCFEYKKKKIH